MTNLKDNERAIFTRSKRVLHLERTDYGFLIIDGDRRAKALAEERKDLDINSHFLLSTLFHLSPGVVAIDVGAYIGDSTVAMLRSGCEVIAFEPFLDAFLCLLFNTRSFGPSITCHNIALGNGESVEFDYSYEGNDCGCRYVKQIPDCVPTMKLDDLEMAKKVSLIKIDVEGWELNVLSGARKFIEQHRPSMFIESYPDALKRWNHTPLDLHRLIEGMGYAIVDSGGAPFTKTDYTSVVDLVCIPK